MSTIGPSRAGVLLRKWIAESGTTQMRLAAELGVSQTTVSAWLAGSEPLATSAGRLQEMAGIPLSAWGEPASDSTRDVSAAADESGEHSAVTPPPSRSTG